MSISNQSSGSIFPDKSLLQRQLYPETDSTDYKEEPINSQVAKGGSIKLWNESILDLPRQTKFLINGKQVYDLSDENNRQYPSNINVTNDTAVATFDHILMACDFDPKNKTSEESLRAVKEAREISHLAHQKLAQNCQQKITIAKGMRKTEEEQILYGFNVVTKVTALDIDNDKKTFQLVQEQLYRLRNQDDPENPTYFKAKTIVSGSKVDLLERNVEKLNVKIAYTKEYHQLESARKSNYLGTRAGGVWDTGSYIK